jgi:hypothetical protein
MTSTVQQQNKASDLREHLSVLQKESQIASDNLTQILKKSADAQGVIDQHNKQQEGFKLEKQRFEDYCRVRTSQLNDREAAIVSMRESDEKRVKNHEDSLERREWNIVAKESALSETERLCNERVKDLNVRIAVLVAQESKQLSSIDENQRVIEELNTKRDIGRSQIDSQRELFAQEETRYNTVIESKKKEIERLDAEAKESLRQVSAPLENLRRKELELMRTKSDIDIYQSRVQARWDYLYPGQVMNL